jgi:hypothetical protein
MPLRSKFEGAFIFSHNFYSAIFFLLHKFIHIKEAPDNNCRGPLYIIIIISTGYCSFFTVVVVVVVLAATAGFL